MHPQITLLASTAGHEGLYRSYETYPDSFKELNSDSEALIEFAGRACYQSFHNPVGRTNPEYIANIIKQKHFSVLEHASVTFYLEGVSRSFTHDLVRHRHHSYSQLSQRYVDSRDSGFVCPPLYLDNEPLMEQWFASVEDAQKNLRALEEETRSVYPELPQKQIREAVRSVAPNSIETKIVVTGNLRAWLEYADKRWNTHADKEICQVSELIIAQLKSLYPAVFEHVQLQGDS